MRLINKIIEPKRLLVIWQARDVVIWQAPDKALAHAAGKRFIVGEIFVSDGNAKLRYYDNVETKEAINFGFTGLTAYPYEANKEYNGNLVDVLSRRLPPDSRPDYEDYLRSYRISPSAENITTLSLLAYTTGKLAGDGFSFANTFEGVDSPFDFTFEIAGFRHNEGMKLENIESLQDVEVTLKKEPSNQYDNNAIAVEYNGKKLGYMPHGINSIMMSLLDKHKIKAFIEKINGTIERPNVLVYVAVE